jgi:hypothetical protein
MDTMVGRVVLPFALALTGCSADVNLGGGPTHQPGGTGGTGSSGGGGGVAGGGCDGLAFCDDFETPAPGGRGGDLDESRWSFGRWAHAVQYFWYRLPASTYADAFVPATFCGAQFQNVLPPADVRVCAGAGVDGTTSLQLHEMYDDQNSAALHSFRARQPFDFAGRTGRIVWDVDAKVNPFNLGHGYWIEIWITDDPAPLPHDELFGLLSLPKNGVGLGFHFGGKCPSTNTSWGNTLETIRIVEDHAVVAIYDDISLDSPTRCFQSFDARLNRMELRISETTVELWATDFESPDSFLLRARAEDLTLPLTRGYVHFQHGQLSAASDGMEGCESGVPNTCPSASQTFRWDNIGFDGPLLASPSGYSVPDNGAPGPEGGVYTGWYLNDGLSKVLTIPGVDLSNATAASLDFNAYLGVGQSLEYRFNGGPLHTFTVPDAMESAPGLRGFSVPIAPAELLNGDNTFEVRALAPSTEVEGIGNVDLTIERN